MKEYFENLGNYLSLKDRVYQNIKIQIIRGNLKPGTRLLEEELSQAMNISRAPIREAFNRLEKEGFVTTIPRKGAAVSNVTTLIDLCDGITIVATVAKEYQPTEYLYGKESWKN